MRKHMGVPTFLVAVLLLPLNILFLPSASAQQPSSVTLRASTTRFDYGRATTLSGRISPAQAHQQVQIVDERGRIRASTRTDAQGRYSVQISPRANTKVRARWLAALSHAVYLNVRPLVNVHLGRVRLFAQTRISGSLKPAHRGDSVKVSIFRNGNRVGRRHPDLKKGRWFSTRFRIKKPGTYQVKASFNDADHAFASSHTVRKSPLLPSLSSGSKSVYVKLLERRLHRLQYHVPRPDRSFDYRTADAVIAFNKVQGRSRVGSVDASTWRALASPYMPKPVSRKPRLHIEVDQTRQVLYVVRHGRIDDTIHVSTGAGGGTNDGVFHVYQKIAGYSPHRLYYPSYFDGERAIHGWPDVPTYAASHGCVRVPYWTAKWIFRIDDIGIQVHVYHS
jgi:hypothetical protein